MKINAVFVKGLISSNEKNAFDFMSKGFFGEREGDKVVYSPEECLFLVKEGKMDVFDFRGKALSESDLVKKFKSKDRFFWERYVVFEDLRKRGYILKSGMKFGADFRMYESKKVLGKHSKWLVRVFRFSDFVNLRDFVSAARVANSTKKILVLAVVDGLDVSYYEAGWKRF